MLLYRLKPMTFLCSALSGKYDVVKVLVKHVRNMLALWLRFLDGVFSCSFPVLVMYITICNFVPLIYFLI